MAALIAIAFIVIALIGTPLFLVFGSAAMYLFGSSEGGSITSVAIDVFSEKFADSPTLVTIPLFTIAGYLMAEGGTPKRLIELSRALLGWLPGGLAVVCLCTSAFFTTFTGGSGITIVAIGGLLMPALIQERYPRQFALGLVTSGGSLGIMFPPAVPLILYAIVANILIDKLFMAGLIPGILTVLSLAIYSSVVASKAKIERTPFDAKRAWRALWHAKWEIGLPVVIIGGLASGLLRVHEASAFTGLYVLLVELFIYRELDWRRDLPRIVRESMTLVGAILSIMSMAIGFTSFLIQAQVPLKLLTAMQTLITSKFTFLLVLNVFLLIAGMVMEIFAAIFVVVPLIVPIAKHFGIDPYHLGIVFLVNLEIAYLAPPLGLNLMISSFRFATPVADLYKSVLPFIGVLTITLMITTYIPSLSTWLPSLSSQQELYPEDVATPDEDINFDDKGLGGETLDDLEAESLDDLQKELTLDDLEKEEEAQKPDGASQEAPSPASEVQEGAPPSEPGSPEGAQ